MQQISPALFVGIGVIIYILGYLLYARYIDKNVWSPDSKVKTPAHMYMDGVEFFPTSKSVLFGFQFKSIAALGPISGPFIALVFGWLPAFLWIIFGTFFIGWIHDYSAVMITVRSEGESFGPIAYRMVGSRARKGLMGFIIFYLILVMAVFAYMSGSFFRTFPQSIIPTIMVIAGGAVAGLMMYRLKMNIVIATLVGFAFMIFGVWLGLWLYLPAPYGIAALGWVATTPVEWWIILALALVFIGATMPITDWAQPVNYIAFWPCFVAVILIIIGALLSPFYPGDPIVVQTQPINTLYTPTAGPIWPILFVTIACGAVSGWHSLVGSGATGKQIASETDVLPVAGGSMFVEGLLAISAMSAYIVIASEDLVAAWFLNFPVGAAILTGGMFGGGLASTVLIAFFAMVLELYAITVLQLMPRFFRLAAADLAGPSAIGALFRNKWIGVFIGVAIAFVFAATGAWYHLWLLFGGSNQLLAALALMLASLYLARAKKPRYFTLIPALFMIVTCEAALIWEAWVFIQAVVTTGYYAQPNSLLANLALGGNIWPAVIVTYTFIAFAFILFILGLLVFADAWKALRRGPEGAAAQPVKGTSNQ